MSVLTEVTRQIGVGSVLLIQRKTAIQYESIYRRIYATRLGNKFLGKSSMIPLKHENWCELSYRPEGIQLHDGGLFALLKVL